MNRFYDKVIQHRKLILTLFAVAAVLMLICMQFVAVNYDMNSYLPKDSSSTLALEVMEKEFDGGIPNARVMIYDVSIAEALEYKEQLAGIDGVSTVQWLDDSVSITQPLELADAEVVETYYKDGNALFTVTIEENYIIDAVADIRELIGEDNAMTGSAVNTAIATESTVDEIKVISVIAILFVLFILILTTTSWLEPVIILLGLGTAVVINAGSNLMFGEISFVTNAAGNILQLAVSLDYSVFLIHRFEECRKEEANPETAMRNALVKSTFSILSSGLTTVIGFLALVLMRFRIGPDLGLALAKGVAISLITVFLFMPGFILSTYKWLDKTKHRSFMPDFHFLGKFVSKIMLPLAVGFIILIIPAYLSSINNSYYYGSSHIFGKGTQLGDDTKAIKEIFGEKDTYVLLVPKGDTAKESALSNALKQLNGITDIISFVDMAGAEIPYEYLDNDTLSLLESDNYSRMVITADVPYEGEETTALIDALRECINQYYPDCYYLAGEGISTYDLQETVTADMLKVNLVAIGAVFIVLLLSMKSILLPLILVLTIETAIWINLSIPYYINSTLFYIAYLIISSIQLGATVDYAILLTDRYREHRLYLNKKDSVIHTISSVTVSIITSGSTLAVVGFLLGVFSTHGLLSQLGFLIGRGSICSIIAVLFILPGFLYMFDRTFTGRKGGTNMKKCAKQVTALLLAGVLLTGNSTAALAAQSPSEKEEVVYAMLDSNGNVTGVYVVNSFSGGDIVDYGDYAAVRNMTTTDEIHSDGDKISLSTEADKIYYQGNLKTTDIPWNFSIHYYMDGKEYTPSEIAGMSGKLDIKMSITQNPSCDKSFFEGYALQATLLLDTKKCSDITAEGATIANVASKKQLSYIILPGKETELSISADVTDFEMEEISINGVRLNLDMKFDDSRFQEQVQKIQTAGSELNNGAAELNNGAGSLNEATRKLNDGIADIQNALNTLNGQSAALTDGSAEIFKALWQIQTALNDVSANFEKLSELSEASAQIKHGIDSLVTGLNTLDGTVSQYYQSLQAAGLDDTGVLAAQNEQMIAALGITDTQRILYQSYVQGETSGAGNGVLSVLRDIQELANTGNTEAITLISQYQSAESNQAGSGAAVIRTYIENAGKLITVEALLTADKAYIDGSSRLISGIDNALDSESGTLMTGAHTLQDKYDEFNINIQALVLSLEDLAQNMGSLKTGIDTLVTHYTVLDDGINGYTGAVAQILEGYNSLYEGSLQLAEGTSSLYSGTQDLLAGTENFQSETADMDIRISDIITDTIDTMTGKHAETISFVSEKNTNIDSVLFVIKTQAIEKTAEKQPAPSAEKKRSLWQKFLDIFR